MACHQQRVAQHVRERDRGMTGRKGQVWTRSDGVGVYLLLNLLEDELAWNCLVLDHASRGDVSGTVIRVADVWFKIFAKRIA